MAYNDITYDEFCNPVNSLSDINFQVAYTNGFLMTYFADKILKGLESEVVYLSNQVTQMKVLGKWRTIPRQEVAYGDKGTRYWQSGMRVPGLPWPSPVKYVRTVLQNLTGYRYNFAWVYKYRDGYDRIGDHKFDDDYLDPDAPIATLSFGQTRNIVFTYNPPEDECVEGQKVQKRHAIPLRHGDLLVMYPPTNQYWSHAVPPMLDVKGATVNLTFYKMMKMRYKL